MRPINSIAFLRISNPQEGLVIILIILNFIKGKEKTAGSFF